MATQSQLTRTLRAALALLCAATLALATLPTRALAAPMSATASDGTTVSATSAPVGASLPSGSAAHGYRIDPHHPNRHFLLLDGIGIASSTDGGSTWTVDATACPAGWSTCYDLVFDEYREGIAWSVWSDRAGAPGTGDGSELTAHGGIAYSSDGGVTWEKFVKGGTEPWESGDAGLPANSLPVKMAVAYPKDTRGYVMNGDRTIYVACFGGGFYMSTDSGSSFADMNAGVAKSRYLTGPNPEDVVRCVFAADVEIAENGKVFGLVRHDALAGGLARSHWGCVYEWAGGSWHVLPTKKNGVPAPVEIFSRGEVLYVGAMPFSDESPGSPYGGGLFTYEGSAYGTGTYKQGYLNAHAPASPKVGVEVTIVGAREADGGNLFIADDLGNVYLKSSSFDYEPLLAAASTTPGVTGLELVGEERSADERTLTVQLILHRAAAASTRLSVTVVSPASADSGDSGSDGSEDPGTAPDPGEVRPPYDPGPGEGGSEPTRPEDKYDERPPKPVTPVLADDDDAEPTVEDPSIPEAHDAGWTQENGAWYYYNEDGEWVSGWVRDGGAWYYLSSLGVMQTSWVNDGSSWYWLGDDGAMRTGWQYVSAAWYWLGDDGAMRTGWFYDGNAWYHAAASGEMAQGTWLAEDGAWYYVRADGSMAANGWQVIDDRWYYFGSSGRMYANERTPDGAWVGEDGAWV